MANHKLYIEDFDEIDYELIGIHTALEAYRLAYFLNQKLPILLSKNKKEVQINTKEGETYFTRYFYENKEKNTTWNLIENKNKILIPKKDTTQNLFTNSDMKATKNVFLIPEFKKVDYFLRIEDDSLEITDIVTAIHSIDWVEAAYAVDIVKIKSKNNLIF
jgi:hypothetical protein